MSDETLMSELIGKLKYLLFITDHKVVIYYEL